jgi:hypothetical protein
MKKLFITLALAAGLLFVQNASAQAPVRIKPPKGVTPVVVNGVTGTEGATYVIKAKGGQNMTLNLTPASGAGIKVEADRSYGHVVLLKDKKGGTYKVGIEESGDCTIFIGATKRKSVPFTLSVRFTKLADI